MTTGNKIHAAATRAKTRQLSGHFPESDVITFRTMAAEQNKDVQELLAEAINLVFERYSLPRRIPIASGRRKRPSGPKPT